MQAEQFNKTVQKIYAAAADASLWREALVAVEDFTGSTGAVVNFVPLTENAPPLTFGGSFSQDDCYDYAVNYQPICSRIAFAARHPEIPTQFDRMVLSETEMDRDPVYDWLGKHGLRYYIGGPGARTERYGLFFSLQRSRRQGHVDEGDVALFDMVRPHLAQAVAIADSLDTLAAHRRFSDTMLDALPQAVFGLDATGLVLFANASADKLLASGDTLRSERGRLVTTIPAQQRQLDALIASALSGAAGGAMRIDRCNGQQPCAARVSPIVVDKAERFLRPAVLVIVSDPAAVMPIDEETLRSLYELTPAEARTAAALVEGHSIQSAAQLLGISGETLRSHLKAVFRKVGVSRQQDLVRVLAELEMSSVGCPPAPVDHGA